MPLTKYAGLGYPTHFLKSRGNVLRNHFLEYRNNKATHFARRNDLYALLAIYKAKNILRLFCVPVVTQLIVKSIKKNLKKSHF